MTDIQKLMEAASDSDPERKLREMWDMVAVLAEEAGRDVPAPLVTKTFTVEVTARFPLENDENEVIMARDILATFDHDGIGEDQFVKRVEVKLMEP